MSEELNEARCDLLVRVVLTEDQLGLVMRALREAALSAPEAERVVINKARQQLLYGGSVFSPED